jgi:hypothetical protein
MRSIRCYRQPDHQHHNRNRHGQRNPSESSESYRCSCDHNRCGYVRRPEELTPVTLELANLERGLGRNIPESPLPVFAYRGDSHG